jgi:hypothetical protein
VFCHATDVSVVETTSFGIALIGWPADGLPGGVDPEAETDPVIHAPEVRYWRAAGLPDRLAQGGPLAGAALLMHGPGGHQCPGA